MVPQQPSMLRTAADSVVSMVVPRSRKEAGAAYLLAGPRPAVLAFAAGIVCVSFGLLGIALTVGRSRAHAPRRRRVEQAVEMGDHGSEDEADDFDGEDEAPYVPGIPGGQGVGRVRRDGGRSGRYSQAARCTEDEDVL